jgi:hypothetical protein
MSRGMALPVEPEDGKNNSTQNASQNASSTTTTTNFHVIPKMNTDSIMLAFLGNPSLSSSSSSSTPPPSPDVQIRFDYFEGHATQTDNTAWIMTSSSCPNVCQAKRLIIIDKNTNKMKFFVCKETPF